MRVVRFRLRKDDAQFFLKCVSKSLTFHIIFALSAEVSKIIRNFVHIAYFIL